MTSLTDRFQDIATDSRGLEFQAARMTRDVARLSQSIAEMTRAIDYLSNNCPAERLRRAAAELRAGRLPQGEMFALAAE